MQLYEIILEIIIILWCITTFIYSVLKIFKKETSRFLIFVCLSDLCFLVEELCGTIYWLINPTGMLYSFQTSILGTMSVFLFLFTASFGVLDKQIKKEEQNTSIKIVSLLAPLAVLGIYIASIFICLNKNLERTILPLTLMVLPVLVCSYFTLKHILLRKKSEVCNAAFKINLIVLLASFLTLAYAVTYLIAPLIVSNIINFVCAILFGMLPLICIKDNKSWKI